VGWRITPYTDTSAVYAGCGRIIEEGLITMGIARRNGKIYILYQKMGKL
jgi:hypothetical protein